MARLSVAEPAHRAGDQPGTSPGPARGRPAAPLSPTGVLALQRAAGNAAVGRLLEGRAVARQPPSGAAVTPVSGPSSASLRRPPPATVTQAVLGKELTEKLEKMMADAQLSSSSSSGREMRYSLIRETELKLPALFSLTSRYELSPNQLRLQWGQETEGHRIDSWSGLRWGTRDWAIEALVRTTYASGKLARVEDQQVGMLRLTLGGHFTGEYYNDHRFLWFPMGGGTDQGDTAGVRLNYGKIGAPIAQGWQLEGVGANLRLATGIPDRNKTVDIGGHPFYTDVAHDEVRRGAVSLSANFLHPGSGYSLTVEGGLDSERIRDATQNKLIHRNLDIPEFQVKPLESPYFSFTLTKSF